MFIENGFFSGNKFWKYLVGLGIIFLANIIGQVPLLIAIFYKALKENLSFPTDNTDLLTFLDPNFTLFLIMISFVFAFGAIYLVITHLHKQSFLAVTTIRSKVDWNRILFSFTVWGIFSIGITMLMYFLTPSDYVFNFKPIPFLILTLISIILLPFQTSTEEYIFRGYLMQGLGLLSKNKWFPLIITSVLFGGMHIANPEVEKMGEIIMVYYIGTGFFLGIITLMDEGLELALGFHAANNFFTALMVTSEWSAFQTHSILKDISTPSVGFEILTPVLVVFPLLLLLFSWRYKWTNWKDKLIGTIKVENY